MEFSPSQLQRVQPNLSIKWHETLQCVEPCEYHNHKDEEILLESVGGRRLVPEIIHQNAVEPIKLLRGKNPTEMPGQQQPENAVMITSSSSVCYTQKKNNLQIKLCFWYSSSLHCCALKERLVLICDQSQPMILSGYYCLIELGIEQVILIARILSRSQH